ncbi:MAG: tetratricopeptide repeat protein, partial [Planctomycetota bacterium]
MRCIEMETLEKVLAGQKSGELSGPIGKVLVECEHISQEDLDAALHYQLVEELLEIFYWSDVGYEFYSVPPEQALRDRADRLTRVDGGEDANRILLDVTKIIDDIDKFNQATPSMKDVYEIIGDREKYVAEHEVEDCVVELLDLIDGEHDMGEVLKAIRLSRLDAMELFYHFKSIDLIRAKNSFELIMLSENRRNSFSAAKRARLYERAAELGAEGFEISLRTAEAYEELEQFEKAADHYLAHAKSVEESGTDEDAVEAIAKAIELRPERTDVLEFRASLLHRLGKNEEAAEDLLRLAGLRRARKEHALAEQALDTALQLTPENEEIRLARIAVIEEIGETSRAARACLELACLRELAKELEGAFEMARRAVSMEPGAIRFRTALANLLTRAEKNDEAADALGEIVPIVLERAAGNHGRVILVLTALRARLDDLSARTSGAMEKIAEGWIELDEKDEALEVLSDAGEARIAQGLLEEAERAFRRTVEISPDDDDLAETLALVQARNGAKEHALARLRGIAGRLQKQENTERAEKVYREMLRIDPFCPDAVLQLARMKVDAGEKKEAAAGLHRVGDLYKVTDNLEEAVTHLDEACRLDPGNPAYVRDLADALGRALKTEKSMETYDALLAMLRARSEHTGVIDLARRMLESDADHKVALEAMMDAYSGLGEELRSRVKGSAAEVT